MYLYISQFVCFGGKKRYNIALVYANVYTYIYTWKGAVSEEEEGEEGAKKIAYIANSVHKLEEKIW